MPWNDNANPGPWGSPPSGDDGDRKRPAAAAAAGGGRAAATAPAAPTSTPASSACASAWAACSAARAAACRPGAIAAIAGVVFALWALSGLYVVQPNEEAVVTTFGAYSRSEAPGLRYHLPAPIERVEKVPVTTLNRIDIGGAGTADGDVPQESLMLTSDENIIDLYFSVTWRVADAAALPLRDPQPGRGGEGRGRKRHARGDRQDPAAIRSSPPAAARCSCRPPS